MAYLYRPFTIDNILIVVDDAVVLYSFDVEVFFLFFSFFILSFLLCFFYLHVLLAETQA